MTDRPILFQAPMVRAILDGRKTQTRRVIKPQPRGFPIGCVTDSGRVGWGIQGIVARKDYCPHGQIGDRLWVRETFITGYKMDPDTETLIYYNEEDGDLPETVWYKADGDLNFWMGSDGYTTENIPWKPSIHMPRWASRITLEITNIRIERLQNITEEDAIKEGCSLSAGGLYCGGPHKAHGAPTQHNTAKEAYLHVWESINGPTSWSTNPWVWVIEFKRVII